MQYHERDSECRLIVGICQVPAQHTLMQDSSWGRPAEWLVGLYDQSSRYRLVSISFGLCVYLDSTSHSVKD